MTGGYTDWWDGIQEAKNRCMEIYSVDWGAWKSSGVLWVVPTTYMIKPWQLPAQSFISCQVFLWYETLRQPQWNVYHCSARLISLLFRYFLSQHHYYFIAIPGWYHNYFIPFLANIIKISLVYQDNLITSLAKSILFHCCTRPISLLFHCFPRPISLLLLF